MDKDYFVKQLLNIVHRFEVNLDAELIGEIVNSSIFSVIKKDEVLQHIGDKTKNAGIVLNGITRSYYIDENGNDITRGFSAEGMLCMDEGIFGYTESVCECETLEETTLMIFEVAGIKKMIYENEQLKNVYLSLLENALRYKIYRENGFLIESASERYIHFRKLYPEICCRVTQQHIATYLGIAPESLSRIRKALKDNETVVM